MKKLTMRLTPLVLVVFMVITSVQPAYATPAPSTEDIETAIGEGVLWLTNNQNPDGGWGMAIDEHGNPVPHSSAMETSMAIIGFSVAIEYDDYYLTNLAPLIIKGAEWLVANQNATYGYWVWEYIFAMPEWGGLPNVVSTYMGMLGLTIASEFAPPDVYEDDAENALDWILSAQNRDGGWGLVPKEYVTPMLLKSLKDLKARVEDPEYLPVDAFKKPEFAEYIRRKLCYELDMLIRLVERGMYEWALRVLERFEGEIKRWIVDPWKIDLLKEVEAIALTALLAVSDPLTTSGPAWGLCLTLSESDDDNDDDDNDDDIGRTAYRQMAAITRAAWYLLSEQEEDGSWSTIAGPPQKPYTVTRAVDFLITYKMIMQMITHDQPRRLVERVERSIALGIEWIQDNNLVGLEDPDKMTRDVVDALVVFEDAAKAGIDVDLEKAQEAVNWLLDTQGEGGWGLAPSYLDLYDTVFDTAFVVAALAWSVKLPLEPLDPLKLLEELKGEVSNLDDVDFVEPKRARWQRWILCYKIDGVIRLVQKEKYGSAMRKLERDVKAKMERWLVDPSDLIDKVDTIIGVLEQLT